jgi:hypothetical protein
MLHLKLLEKQEQAKNKTNRRKEIIEIRAKIIEIETKNKQTSKQTNKKTQNIQIIETKSWFFEKK